MKIKEMVIFLGLGVSSVNAKVKANDWGYFGPVTLESLKPITQIEGLNIYSMDYASVYPDATIIDELIGDGVHAYLVDNNGEFDVVVKIDSLMYRADSSGSSCVSQCGAETAGQAGESGIQGAGIGAAVGSIGGPKGAVGGAIIGGLAGGLSGGLKAWGQCVRATKCQGQVPGKNEGNN